MIIRPGKENRPADSLNGVILDCVADGVFTVGPDFRITSFNRAAEKITGVDRDSAIGARCSDVFKTAACEQRCALKEALRTARPVVNRAMRIVGADGSERPISVSASTLVGEDGEIIGCVETLRDLSLVQELRRELRGRNAFRDIISGNRAMHALFSLLPEAARSGGTVLLSGPGGSGKELFARAIHDLGPHRDGPFVPVSCNAVPEALLASDLFGYTRGAVPGAMSQRVGRLAAAAGGTLFLDEVAALSLTVQADLIRILDDDTYEPFGSHAPVPAGVRIIAATSRDLDSLVAEGGFREDLFYRLTAIRLRIPPLKDRLEDIPLLTEHFVSRLGRLRGKGIVGLTGDALGLLMDYDWPGNVRELLHAIEYAFVVCSGDLIGPKDLPAGVRDGAGATAPGPRTLEEAEAKFIREILARHDGSRTMTSLALGIHKTTLWRKMRRHGIE